MCNLREKVFYLIIIIEKVRNYLLIITLVYSEKNYFNSFHCTRLPVLRKRVYGLGQR